MTLSGRLGCNQGPFIVAITGVGFRVWSEYIKIHGNKCSEGSGTSRWRSPGGRFIAGMRFDVVVTIARCRMLRTGLEWIVGIHGPRSSCGIFWQEFEQEKAGVV
jgi:hypothetical protein